MELVELGKGLPSPDVFPAELMEKATKALLMSDDIADWGTYGNPAGVIQGREQLAQFLSREVGEKILPEELALTCGVSGAIDLVLQLYSKPGDQIIVEDPTYYEAKNFIAQYQLTPIPIESSLDGFDVDALEKKLESKSISPTLMYIVSDFSNPQGITVVESKRIKLVELAHKFQFLIISDEVYQLLYFTEAVKPPKPMALYDYPSDNEKKGVISLSSISKTIMPSLRIGWILCKHPGRLEKFFNRAVETSGGLHSFYNAGIFAKAIERGLFTERLEQLRALYRGRCNSMISAIENMISHIKETFPNLEGDITFHKPQGGFFIWLRFPSWMDSTSLLKEFESKYNTSYKPGPIASFGESVGKHSIRLCFVFYPPKILEQAIQNLQEFLIKQLSQ